MVIGLLAAIGLWSAHHCLMRKTSRTPGGEGIRYVTWLAFTAASPLSRLPHRKSDIARAVRAALDVFAKVSLEPSFADLISCDTVSPVTPLTTSDDRTIPAHAALETRLVSIN